MTTTKPTMKSQPTAASEYARAHQLGEVFPGLYSETAWKAFLRTGAIPSFSPPGSRARLVRLADVRAFLEGQGTRGTAA